MGTPSSSRKAEWGPLDSSSASETSSYLRTDAPNTASRTSGDLAYNPNQSGHAFNPSKTPPGGNQGVTKRASRGETIRRPSVGSQEH